MCVVYSLLDYFVTYIAVSSCTVVYIVFVLLQLNISIEYLYLHPKLGLKVILGKSRAEHLCFRKGPNLILVKLTKSLRF